MEMMEAGKDYGVRVIRPFAQFSVGRVLFPEGPYRSDLIRRNLVEVVKAPKVEDQKHKAAARREQ